MPMEGLNGGGDGTKNNNQKSVTTPISDDLRKDLNTDPDLEKRKKGAENFGLFAETFERILLKNSFTEEEYGRQDNREAIYYGAVPRLVMASLQALFLGEKPMVRDVFNDRSSVTREQREQTYQLLRNFGFEILPDDKGEVFVYDPKLVQEVIRKYPEVFGDVTVEKALNPKFLEMDDMRLGLLLGYPKEACEGYKEQRAYRQQGTESGAVKAKEMLEEANRYRDTQEDKNLYGFGFINYHAGEETRILRDRLRRAFHESGILKIWDTEKK